MQQAGDVLEFLAFQHRRNLLVLPVEGVTWSDWGTSAWLWNALRQLETQSVRGSGATGKVRESRRDEHVKGSANRRMNLAGCRHGLEDPEAREVGTSWR
jgi:hypothetical protein